MKNFTPYRSLFCLLCFGTACLWADGQAARAQTTYDLTGDGLFYYNGVLTVDSDYDISAYIAAGTGTAIPAGSNILGDSFTLTIGGGANGSSPWYWANGVPFSPGEVVTLDNGYAFTFTSTMWTTQTGGQGGAGGGHRGRVETCYYTVTVTTIPAMPVPPTGTVSSPTYVRIGTQVPVSFQVSPRT